MKITPKRLIQALIIILCVLFVWLYFHTPLSIRTDTAPDSYLPISDYALLNPETNEEHRIVGRLSYPDIYTHYNYDDGLETPRQMKPGDTWDRFVEVYGDFIASSIDVSDTRVPYSKRDTAYYETHNFTDTTIKEFDETYVKTGIIDLDYCQTYITYEVVISGNKVSYTEEEKQQAFRDYYDRTYYIFDIPLHFGADQNHTIDYSFHFNGSQVNYAQLDYTYIDSISLYHYNF